MKGYIKYIALFIILVLVGVVSINFYNTSRLDTNEKTEEKTKSKKDTKTEENKEVIKKETNESGNNKEEPKENSIDTTKNTLENNNTSTNQNNVNNSSSNTEQKTSNNNSSTGSNTNNSSAKETTTTTQSGTSKESNNNTPESYNIIDVNDYKTTTSNTTTYSNSSNTPTKKSNTSTKSTNSSTKEEYNEIVIDNSKSNPTTSSSTTNSSTNKSNQTIKNSTTNNNTSQNSQTASTSTNTEEKKQNSVETVVGESKNPDDTTTTTNTKTNNTSTKTTTKDGNIIGATGYTALNSKKYLRSKPSNSSTAIVVLKPGVPFKILDKNSKDTWWKVSYNGKTGYVENAYCLINLPDYIPSITYKITNANKNISKSSGVKLSVYGKKLYAAGKVYNERLEKEEYIVPVVYSFAQKILTAQKAALKDGYSLKIYDAYRPKSVANELRDSLAALYNSNSTVRKNINYSYDAKGNQYTWGQGWFTAQILSAHSLASAIDVSLTKKGETKSLKMPSSMHELSTKSIKYTYGVPGQTTVRSDLYSSNMTPAAKKLDAYMMNAGLTSLASEWWHFQDNTAYNRIKSYEPQGLNFQPTKVVSSK